jgi:hypothetical protein
VNYEGPTVLGNKDYRPTDAIDHFRARPMSIERRRPSE